MLLFTLCGNLRGNAQCPLQLSRVDDSIDPNFDENDNANILIPGVDYDPSQEMVVLPGDAGDPYNNSQNLENSS